jgi:hypothetical protein
MLALSSRMTPSIRLVVAVLGLFLIFVPPVQAQHGRARGRRPRVVVIAPAPPPPPVVVIVPAPVVVIPRQIIL